jgi:predicted house-cleaning noncanonical NTP pyrophosphatase (MazG superfamily)
MQHSDEYLLKFNTICEDVLINEGIFSGLVNFFKSKSEVEKAVDFIKDLFSGLVEVFKFAVKYKLLNKHKHKLISDIYEIVTNQNFNKLIDSEKIKKGLAAIYRICQEIASTVKKMNIYKAVKRGDLSKIDADKVGEDMNLFKQIVKPIMKLCIIFGKFVSFCMQEAKRLKITISASIDDSSIEGNDGDTADEE